MNYVLNEDWSKVLSNRFTQEYKKELFTWLEGEYASKVVFPPKEKVFNALIDSGSNADENSCMNTIKSSYPDTYNFLRSLCDGHMNIFDYT